MSPKKTSNESAVAVRSRELAASHESQPVSTWKVNKGTAAGVESKNAMVMPPLMMPKR
jgi:hypothetical protein